MYTYHFEDIAVLKSPFPRIQMTLSTYTSADKFENGNIFLRIRRPSTRIRIEHRPVAEEGGSASCLNLLLPILIIFYRSYTNDPGLV